jgi:hypothetical protein
MSKLIVTFLIFYSSKNDIFVIFNDMFELYHNIIQLSTAFYLNSIKPSDLV